MSRRRARSVRRRVVVVAALVVAMLGPAATPAGSSQSVRVTFSGTMDDPFPGAFDAGAPFTATLVYDSGLPGVGTRGVNERYTPVDLHIEVGGATVGSDRSWLQIQSFNGLAIVGATSFESGPLGEIGGVSLTEVALQYGCIDGGNPCAPNPYPDTLLPVDFPSVDATNRARIVLDVEGGGIQAGGTITAIDQPPVILPFGVLVEAEGDGGSSIWRLPVFLSIPWSQPVSIDYATVELTGAGQAATDEDFRATAGTLTFPAGETTGFIEIEVLGDEEDEPPALWGEWGLVEFSNPSAGAILDDNTFFGYGLFVIVDDD